jgi:hypothetical protein
MPQRQWTGERHWLRELRGNRSLREIGEPHGFASGALSGFEQGRGVPTLETLPRSTTAANDFSDRSATRESPAPD